MKRPSTSSRRLFVRLGTAAVGVLVALSIASPASACQVTLKGEATCQDSGTYLVTWTLNNDWSKAKITTFTPSYDSPVTTTSGDTIKEGTEFQGVLEGQQTVKGSSGDQVSLTVAVQWTYSSWFREHTTDVSKSVTFPVALPECEVVTPPSPPESPSPTPSETAESPSPSASPTASPSPSASSSPTPVASASPSSSPSAVVPVVVASTPAGSLSGGLPVTGAPTIAIISVAAVLIVGGGALLVLTRRRRSSAAQ